MLEEISVFYRGLVLGAVVSAPVGPVGLLCVRRTLQKGMGVGLATGLGAACADTVFGTIAIFGIGAIIDFIHHYASAIRLLGGAVVLISAWHAWHDTPKPPHPNEIVEKVLRLSQEKTLKGTVQAGLSGFLITLTNPLALFGTLAVVATFGEITEKLEADVMISGILWGAALWWLALSSGVSLLRRHFTEDRLTTLNRLTAIGLAALAGWAIASGIHGYLK